MDDHITLPARYYRMYGEERPYGSSEDEFGLVTRTLDLPIAQTVLVLVDCWSMHFCRSWLARAEAIMEERIVPVRDACRSAGIEIVHAPSPEVAAKYPQATEYAEPSDRAAQPIYAERDPDWPPAEFADRSGPHAGLTRQAAIPKRYWEEPYKDMRIAPILEPTEEESVISTGVQMHRLLKTKVILHVIYAGFATNMCIQYRDYGVRAMAQRGYNVILLSDCTAGMEYHDTLDGLWATHVAIRETELFHGFSAMSPDLLDALSETAR